MSSNKITVTRLREMKRDGRKISCLTCYDASFARLMEQAGIELLLVGDSLGMVVQGQSTTLPVSLDEMVYHARNVARACHNPLLIVDLPFMSYASPEQALRSAARLMQEGGAQMVKLEGGGPVLESVRRMTEQGIPVCAHLGLLPQSVHKLGGYRVQGRDDAAAARILKEAYELQEAGADLLVLECVPASLGAEVSATVEIPVIGIGAGSSCDGQVLVVYDMLGMNPNPASFVRDFLGGAGSIEGAFQAYVAAVRDGSFPTLEQAF